MENLEKRLEEIKYYNIVLDGDKIVITHSAKNEYLKIPFCTDLHKIINICAKTNPELFNLDLNTKLMLEEVWLDLKKNKSLLTKILTKLDSIE